MAFLDSRPEGLYRIKGYVDFGAHDPRNRYAVHAVGRFLRFYPEPWAAGTHGSLSSCSSVPVSTWPLSARSWRRARTATPHSPTSAACGASSVTYKNRSGKASSNPKPSPNSNPSRTSDSTTDRCYTGPATTDTVFGSDTPEPSRRGSISGSSAGVPSRWAALAGTAPAQARERQSSPFRKRWQRTPPVARPLRGYWSNGVSLAVVWTESSSVPREPATVKTTASTAGSTAVKEMTFAPSVSLMPAMPPAARPWGRTWEAW